MIRFISALLLAMVALVPSLVRTQDRLHHQPVPASQYSRFRWSNSCEPVPQKAATTIAVQPVTVDAELLPTDTTPVPTWHLAPRDEAPRPLTPPSRTPLALRAPPVSLA